MVSRQAHAGRLVNSTVGVRMTEMDQTADRVCANRLMDSVVSKVRLPILMASSPPDLIRPYTDDRQTPRTLAVSLIEMATGSMDVSVAGGAWQETLELAQGYGWVVRELESGRNLPMPGKFRESGPTEDVAFPVTFGKVGVQSGDAERLFFIAATFSLKILAVWWAPGRSRAGSRNRSCDVRN